MGSFLDPLVAQPFVYDAIQRFFGAASTRNRLAPLLASAGNGRVLDVGGGTGLYRRAVPASARYYLLDLDPLKLHGFKSAHPADQGLQGDATRLPLSSQSIDTALCVALSHHLTDEQLQALMSELARVVRTRLIFLDALVRPASLVSNLLWRYDRGSQPRRADMLRRALEARFVCERVERYTIYHEYLLWVGAPKAASE